MKVEAKVKVKVKVRVKAKIKVKAKVNDKVKAKVKAKVKVTAKIKVKPRSRGSNQKDVYSASRSFGVTLADEFGDVQKTGCLIAAVPTQDPGIHYSACWSFGITLVGRKQIRHKLSDDAKGKGEGKS